MTWWRGTGWFVLCLASCAVAQEGGTLDADVPVVFVRTIDPTIEAVLRGVPVPAIAPGVVVPTVPVPVLPRLDLAAVHPPLPVAGQYADLTVSVLLPAVPQPIVLAPAGAPAGAAPVTGPPLPAAPALGLSARAEAELALLRLRAGDHSPATLTALGGLGRQRLLALVTSLPVRPASEAVADGLVGALIAGHGLDPSQRQGWPERLSLWVGGYLARRGDERCVALFEQLLARYGGPVDGAVPELAGLAAYHRRVGAWARAAETALRTDRYSSSRPVRGNARVEAARDYLRAGQTDLAEQAYQAAEQSGYGWAAGLAIYDRALRLLEAARYEPARELLSRPVTGRYAEQIEVALDYLRGRLAWFTAGPNAGCAQFAATLQRYRALPAALTGEGLEATVAAAQAALDLRARFAAAPLLVAAPALVLTPRIEECRASGFVLVQALAPRPVAVQATAAAVTATLPGEWIRRDLVWERRVLCWCPTGTRLADDARLVLTVEDQPPTRLEVPLRTLAPEAAGHPVAGVARSGATGSPVANAQGE